MSQTTALSVKAQMFERSKELLFTSLRKDVEAQGYYAAALWNIRKFQLYKEEKCKTMLDFIQKYGLEERKVYRRLKTAEEIARVLQLPEDGELTRKHVDKFIEVKIEVKKLESRNLNLLLTDGSTQQPEIIEEESTLPLIDDNDLFEDFDESDPEFMALQQRFIELRKPKPGVMKKQDPKAALKSARAKGLEIALEHAQKAAYQLHGLSAAAVGLNRSEAAKSELLYYVRLSWYYASTPPSEVFSGYIDYQTALQMDTEEELRDTRPDVFFGLHENWD